MNSDKIRVLFVCSKNACRSQIGEALLREMGGERFDVKSAGIEPGGVNPMTVKILEEIGIDTSPLVSESIKRYLGEQFDYVITVCAQAEEACPMFPGKSQRVHWPIENPDAAEGTEEERIIVFRRVREEIRDRIKELFDL